MLLYFDLPATIPYSYVMLCLESYPHRDCFQSCKLAPPLKWFDLDWVISRLFLGNLSIQLELYFLKHDPSSAVRVLQKNKKIVSCFQNLGSWLFYLMRCLLRIGRLHAIFQTKRING